METIELDVFRRMDYEQFIPTAVHTQRSNNINTVLIIGGVVIVGIIILILIEDTYENKRLKEESKST